MKQWVCLVCLFLSLSPPSLGAEQAGRDLALLNVGLGPRPVGFGNAYTALATDSHAVYWNPAGLVFGKPLQVSTMQAKMASELDVYYLSAVFELADRDQVAEATQKKRAEDAWGVYWVNGTLGDIPLVTANAEGVTQNTDVKPSDYFSYQAHAVGVSYARWWLPNLSCGINVTGIYQGFDKVSGGESFGFSITPGVLWMPEPGLSIGAVIRDLWSGYRWETGHSESVLPELRVGVGWVLAKHWILSGEIRQKTDLRYQPTGHAGVEYIGWDFFRVRAGVDGDRLAAGCGVYAGPLDVQYAYMGDMSEGIGDSHRLGLGVSF